MAPLIMNGQILDVSGDSVAALTIFQFGPWGPNPAPFVNPIDPKKLAWIVLSGMLEQKKGTAIDARSWFIRKAEPAGGAAAYSVIGRAY